MLFLVFMTREENFSESNKKLKFTLMKCIDRNDSNY
jgi:hypothetical protein